MIDQKWVNDAIMTIMLIFCLIEVNDRRCTTIIGPFGISEYFVYVFMRVSFELFSRIRFLQIILLIIAAFGLSFSFLMQGGGIILSIVEMKSKKPCLVGVDGMFLILFQICSFLALLSFIGEIFNILKMRKREKEKKNLLSSFYLDTKAYIHEDFRSFRKRNRFLIENEILHDVEVDYLLSLCKDASKQGEECIVCLQKYPENSQVVRLGCQHCFHGACITNWLKVSPKCPSCKKYFRPYLLQRVWINERGGNDIDDEHEFRITQLAN